MKNLKWSEILYRFFHATFLCGIFVFGAGSLFDIETPTVLHFLFALMPITCIMSVQYGKWKGALAAGGLVLLVTGVLLVVLTPSGLAEMLWEYRRYVLKAGLWSEENLVYFALFQAAFLGLVSFALQIFFEALPYLRGIATVGLFVAMLLNMLTHGEANHLGVVFSLLYIVAGFVEFTKHKWKKDVDRGSRPFMLWILPFLVVYAVLLFTMPYSQEPYDWQFVKDAYHSAQRILTRFVRGMDGGMVDFDVAFTGFSTDGELGGNVEETDSLVMTVTDGGQQKTNIYLTGKIYDTFTGTGWTQNSHREGDERLWDTLESAYHVERIPNDYKSNYFATSRLHIRYDGLNTEYLFAPVKTYRFYDTVYEVKNGDLILPDEDMAYETGYSISYWQMNVDNDAFYEMLEKDLPEDEELWKHLVQTYIDYSDYRPTLQDLEDNREYYQETYGRVPELSEETLAYLEEITKEAETTTEILRAIEAELNSYTYTTTPGALPETIRDSADFMDYFIERKEGYCSYFATAFVLMARAKGIPCRYVEGFCVPNDIRTKTEVMSSMAHAWPEVYYEGFGWVPFEPTPGYGSLRYTPWEVREFTQGNQGGTAVGGDSSPFYGEEEEEEDESYVPLPEMTEEKEDYTGIFLLVEGILLLFMTVLFIVMVTERITALVKYRYMTMEEKFLYKVRRSFLFLSHMKLKRKDSETLEEFGNRIQEELAERHKEFVWYKNKNRQGKKIKEEDLPVHFTYLSLLEACIYGSRKADEECILTLNREMKELCAWVRYHGKMKFIWYILRM